MQEHNNKDSKIGIQQCPEIENVQNEKRLVCKEMYDTYFHEERHKYLIPISNPDVRLRLARALTADNNQDESFSKILDETLEDVNVWIKLYDLCDKFLKQSVLNSQNSSVAKSVAILLSIL